MNKSCSRKEPNTIWLDRINVESKVVTARGAIIKRKCFFSLKASKCFTKLCFAQRTNNWKNKSKVFWQNIWILWSKKDFRCEKILCFLYQCFFCEASNILKFRRNQDYLISIQINRYDSSESSTKKLSLTLFLQGVLQISLHAPMANVFNCRQDATIWMNALIAVTSKTAVIYNF